MCWGLCKRCRPAASSDTVSWRQRLKWEGDGTRMACPALQLVSAFLFHRDGATFYQTKHRRSKEELRQEVHQEGTPISELGARKIGNILAYHPDSAVSAGDSRCIVTPASHALAGIS